MGYKWLAAAAALSLACAAQGADKVNIFLNKQGMGFEGATAISQGTCPMPFIVEALDVDNDGRADLGVAGLGSGTQGCLSILFNQTM